MVVREWDVTGRVWRAGVTSNAKVKVSQGEEGSPLKVLGNRKDCPKEFETRQLHPCWFPHMPSVCWETAYPVKSRCTDDTSNYANGPQIIGWFLEIIGVIFG